MGKPKKPLPLPYVRYLESIAVGADTFLLEESVWIEGWQKSPSSLNTIKKIVHNEKHDTIYVNVFCEKRGRGQWHSFAPERLVKRVPKKKRVKHGN